MNFIPHYAPQIGELAAKFQDMPIILDHLAQAGRGTPAEYDDVLRLAEFPRVYMKFTFDFAPEAERAKIRGLTAKKLFAFT